jgi:hypothetical protein|tara:strand:- start:50 stop:223 length:174 start_codon:yes stop_codon:yes gene_type:complete
MKRQIKSFPKIKSKKPTKGKKIEVPAVKAAKKELTKAQKRLTIEIKKSKTTTKKKGK